MTFAFVTRTSLAGAFALALGAAPALAADPTPAAIGYAQSILIDVGMKPTLDLILPTLFNELEREVVTTRPELKDAVHQAILALSPEFVAQENTVFDQSAAYLASQMSEQELKDVAAFYESPVGKKFVHAQNAAMIKITELSGAWRRSLDVDLLTRLREELKKKGLSF